MRYYGQISPRHAVVAIGLALTASALLHLGSFVEFMEKEGTLLSGLRNERSSAQMAAFRYMTGTTEKQATPEKR